MKRPSGAELRIDRRNDRRQNKRIRDDLLRSRNRLWIADVSPQNENSLWRATRPRTGLNQVVSHYQQVARGRATSGGSLPLRQFVLHISRRFVRLRRMRNFVRRWRTPLPPSIKRRQAVAFRGLTHPGSPMRGFGLDVHANFFVWIINLAQHGTQGSCPGRQARCRRGTQTGSPGRSSSSYRRG